MRLNPKTREPMNQFVPRLEQWYERCCTDEAYITQSIKSMAERTSTNKSDKSVYTYDCKLGNSVHGQEQAPVDSMLHQPQPHLAVPEPAEGMRSTRHVRSASGDRSEKTLDATSTFSTHSNQGFSDFPPGQITADTTISREATDGVPPLATKTAGPVGGSNDIPSRSPKEPRVYCGFQGLGRAINYFFRRRR